MNLCNIVADKIAICFRGLYWQTQFRLNSQLNVTVFKYRFLCRRACNFSRLSRLRGLFRRQYISLVEVKCGFERRSRWWSLNAREFVVETVRDAEQVYTCRCDVRDAKEFIEKISYVVNLHLKIRCVSVNFFVFQYCAIGCIAISSVFIHKVAFSTVISLLVPYLWILINGKLAWPLNCLIYQPFSTRLPLLFPRVSRDNRARNLNSLFGSTLDMIFILEKYSWKIITWYLIVMILYIPSRF